MRSCLTRITTQHIRAASWALVLSVAGLPLVSANESANDLSVIEKLQGSAAASDKQCTWACQKWTKLCNVDPRGVYKCRRSCAKFGETCEE